MHAIIPRVSYTFWKQICPGFHHGEAKHSHPFINICSIPQEMKCSSRYAFYVSAVTLMILSLYTQFLYWKLWGKMKRQGRPRVRGFWISITSEEEKGLFGLDMNNFDLLWIRRIVWSKKEPVVSDLFSFALRCFEVGCCCWHEYKCDLCLCILMAYCSWLVLFIWIWFNYMVN